MRALVVGLVGVVLAGGVAEAKGCPIDHTVYQVVDTGTRLYGTKIERPDLIGAKLSAVRHMSEFKALDGPFAEPIRTAKMTILVRGAKGSFVVERNFATHSSPSFTDASWAANAPTKAVKWEPRNSAKALGIFGTFSDLDVTDGPLSSLKLKPVNCRK